MARSMETQIITIVIAEIFLQANGVQESPSLINSTYTFFFHIENLENKITLSLCSKCILLCIHFVCLSSVMPKFQWTIILNNFTLLQLSALREFFWITFVASEPEGVAHDELIIFKDTAALVVKVDRVLIAFFLPLIQVIIVRKHIFLDTRCQYVTHGHDPCQPVALRGNLAKISREENF